MGGMIHAIRRSQPDWKILVLGFTVDHWSQVKTALHEMDIPSQQVGRGKPREMVAIGRFDAFARKMKEAGDWNNYIRTAEVVLYDEVRHLGTSQTYIDFARKINPLRSYGFDGTPLRNYEDDDQYKLWEDMQTVGYCGPIRIKISYRELQRLGYLPLTYVHFVPMPKPPPAYMKTLPRNMPITTNYTQIYKHMIVENDYRTARFARLITNLAGAGKIIAMVKQHEHARRLMKMLLDNDVESLAWFGSKKALSTSPTRGVIDAPFSTDEVRRRFMETDLRVVVGSSVLSEAISLDVATDAVNLAAGNTFALSGQRAGRIMRRNQGQTPVCHQWDAEDMGNGVLQAQSTKRRAHYIAAGLDVIDVPCPDVLGNLHKYGLVTAERSWPRMIVTSR
jgi:superfamily II DNA or RNA helicase